MDLSIRRATGLLEAEVASDMVGLHIDNGICYGFNATAYRVWQLIEPPTTLSRLCAVLAEEFAVDAATCRDDVHAILENLERDGLVALTPAA